MPILVTWIVAGMYEHKAIKARSSSCEIRGVRKRNEKRIAHCICSLSEKLQWICYQDENLAIQREMINPIRFCCANLGVLEKELEPGKCFWNHTMTVFIMTVVASTGTASKHSVPFFMTSDTTSKHTDS